MRNLFLVGILLCTLKIGWCLNTTTLLWPEPAKMSFNQQATPLIIDPCRINYKISAIPNDYVKQILNVYLIEVFKCKEIQPGNYVLNIIVKNPTQLISYSIDREKYQLTIREQKSWELICDYYGGFLRGMQTFSQLFQINEDKTYSIRGIPILIDDQPEYAWRGLMIDSSRHFLSVNAIKKVIDGLLYSKMNVMHWHITDEDSFPVQIKSHPELNQYGSIGGKYTQNDVKAIISYAKIRGVRVVPEFDTPAHTQSWGRSPNLTDIVLDCNNEYQGQFDPTMDKTYDIVTDVFTQVNSLFEDDYTHFGGDQIEEKCFDSRPSIREWMKANNITTYKDLQIYYRQRQKKIWRNITSKKKAIYWANENINLPVESDDVIHWWGNSKNVAALSNKTNQVVLSNYDLTYLDIGFGNRYGNNYGVYQKWRDVYQFNPVIPKVNVVGGQVCMWSQLNTESTIDQKVWLRANAFNQRLWKSSMIKSFNFDNIAHRLINQAKRLRSRGFKVQPVTVGLCQKDPTICFHS